MQELYQKAKELIDKGKEILIISHRKPDPDTLGSALALNLWLKKMNKSVTLACYDKPSKDFSFLPLISEFVDNFNLETFDLIIIVDAGASYMTNFHLKYENLFSSGIPIINIDHHASNDNFGTLNIVDPLAASATVMVYRMLNSWGVEISEKIATCLLAGVYSDTGGFMHSNTNKEVYDIAAVLMKRGASIADISKFLFRTKTIEALKLWGQVLERACITDDKVVMSVVTDEDFEARGAKPEQLSGVIDYLNMIPDTKFAVLINEDRKGHVKGSFRTRNNNVDLSRIAAVFGGGGHPKASGFMLPGKLTEAVKYEIVSDDMSKKTLEF